METWVVQHAQGPRGRPLACDVLDFLEECVCDWGESIVPIIPGSWGDSGGCYMSPSKYHSLFIFLLQRHVLIVVLELRGARGQVIFAAGSVILSFTND